MAVGTIVAIEVPTARCIAAAGSTPAMVSARSSTGTMMMPPPTPSSPASRPPTAPAPSSAANMGSQDVLVSNKGACASPSWKTAAV